MDWKIIWDILQWVLPVGGLGAIARYFLNRWEREIDRIERSHNAYKKMYEDLNETVQKDVNEQHELRKTIAALSRAVNKVFSCRHFPDCPVNNELLRNKADITKSGGGKRQRNNSRSARSNPGNNPGVEGGDGDPDREPP